MSQELVYQWLKKNPSWHTIQEISDGLNLVNKQSITVNCYKLRKFKFVECRKSRQRQKGRGYLQLEYKYIPARKI